MEPDSDDRSGALIPRSAIENAVWPAIPEIFPARLLALQYQLDQTERWPADRLHQHQFRQLGSLVAHASEKVPFYGSRLASAGYRPGVTVTPELWSKVPILTKRDLQENHAALTSRDIPPSHGAIRADLTSGSLGEPVRVFKTELEQFFWHAITVREELWNRRDWRAKIAVIRRFLGHHNEPTVEGRRADDWGVPLASVFSTGPAVLLDIHHPVDQQAAWLARENPDYLLTFPTNAQALAQHCIENGIEVPRLRGIRTSGEVVTPEMRKTCQMAWGASVADMYSTSEVGYIALQCPDQPQHYHVQSEVALVEILDVRGNPCGPGEMGRVIVTPLHNFALPLLRYDVGDYAELGEACSCGRTLPVLRHVAGRSRMMVTLPSGAKQFPSHPYSLSIPTLTQYQFVQRSLDEVEAKLVMQRPLTSAEAEHIRNYIAIAMGYPFRVRVTYVDAIPRVSGGKYFDFLSDIAP